MAEQALAGVRVVEYGGISAADAAKLMADLGAEVIKVEPPVKASDSVIISTLSHCGRCSKCDEGHPTECRNAPSPKDARSFTIRWDCSVPHTIKGI
jgi:Zn-dependent alcohol dehydrogenase